MPGRRSDSQLGKAIGLAVAGLAVVLLALDRLTGFNVPYGYDSGSSTLVLFGAAIAVLAVVFSSYRYLSGE